VPGERWGRATGYYAGLLEDVAHFDPAFFHISEADAQAMDPQALLLLEESLNLWYQAGYSPQEIKGQAIGVYLGARSQHRPSAEILNAARNPILAVGQNYLASNISRFFDLHGPSLVVDTACSSALVAMQLAIQALRSGEITSALVGGVSLLNISALEIFKERGILNSGPDFHVFDRRAQGALLGEGVGMVWLKSVDQALSDGDQIYAVIKGLAINNDGHIAGPTAPNLQAQKEVMQTALRRSGKQPEQIDYVEVNGSGSEVTDLIELKAIESVYRASSTAPCELGSMKPNIGHPLCAEGIASFIKVVLMLHHRQSVPFLSAREPMTHYDLAASPFYFSRGLDVRKHVPTIAALNCFADGGTNAHLILEAHESETVRRQPISPPVLQKINVYSRPVAVVEAREGSGSKADDGTNGNGKIESQTEPGALCFWEQFSDSNAVATHDNGVDQL
jgi:acyl transferase domain-containing protein